MFSVRILIGKFFPEWIRDDVLEVWVSLDHRETWLALLAVLACEIASARGLLPPDRVMWLP